MIAEPINMPQGPQAKTDFQGFLVIVINMINAPPIKWLRRIFAALPQNIQLCENEIELKSYLQLFSNISLLQKIGFNPWLWALINCYV